MVWGTADPVRRLHSDHPALRALARLARRPPVAAAARARRRGCPEFRPGRCSIAGLHFLTGAPRAVLVGGWIAKMGAVAIYACSAASISAGCERPRASAAARRASSDVFDTLTYRERYEDLLARTGRDALTGALDRGRLEPQGRRAIEDGSCGRRGRSACCSSTSIISRASTTASAMPPATTCCNASPRASWPRCAPTIGVSASAARNSW